MCSSIILCWELERHEIELLIHYLYGLKKVVKNSSDIDGPYNTNKWSSIEYLTSMFVEPMMISRNIS